MANCRELPQGRIKVVMNARVHGAGVTIWAVASKKPAIRQAGKPALREFDAPLQTAKL